MKESYYGLSQRCEIAAIIPKIGKIVRILEIGCGVGGFRQNFTEEAEYWGVEPCMAASNKAKKNLYKVYNNFYENIINELPINYFDLIVLNDVIEHINDTDWFIKSLKNLMVKNGYILGSIPNVRFADNLYRFLILKYWKYIEEGILDKTHLRFFTKKSIIRLFLKNKFKIIEIKGIGKPLLSFKSNRDFFYTIGLKIIPMLFGKDANYLQFAFLITEMIEDESLEIKKGA